jgi:hypothetical protein
VSSAAIPLRGCLGNGIIGPATAFDGHKSVKGALYVAHALHADGIFRFRAAGGECVRCGADSNRANRPFWGTVVKATPESVTVAPEIAAARRNRKTQQPAAPVEKPAERTFALSKDHTELMFAEVGTARMMNDGTIMRTLTEPEPASAADLKAGQLVQVTPGEGGGGNGGNGGAAAAARIIIAWSMPGTIAKVDADEITFRPAAAAGAGNGAGANGAKQRDDAAAGEDQTLAISKTATRVTIATVTDEHPAPNGRGVVRSIEYKAGTLADLKADQSVIICVKNETAVKITILAGDGKS